MIILHFYHLNTASLLFMFFPMVYSFEKDAGLC